MALSVNLPYIRGLAKVLFPDENTNLEKEAAAELVGEMCNQVLKTVKTKFSELGHEIDLGLPDVILGKGHIVMHKAKNPVLYIPIGKDNMGCDLEFCLEQRETEEEEEKKPDSKEPGVINLLKA